MKLLRSHLRVAHAWLAVVALLVTTVPHARCVCPDGHVKTYCFMTPSGPTGCCCGGACCLPPDDSDAQPEVKTPPCCAHRQAVKKPRQAAPQKGLHAAGCTRTAADGDFVAVSPERAGESHPLAGGPCLLLSSADPARTPFVPWAGPLRLSWQSYQLPPPTDLVIALLHLLI